MTFISLSICPSSVENSLYTVSMWFGAGYKCSDSTQLNAGGDWTAFAGAWNRVVSRWLKTGAAVRWRVQLDSCWARNRISQSMSSWPVCAAAVLYRHHHHRPPIATDAVPPREWLVSEVAATMPWERGRGGVCIFKVFIEYPLNLGCDYLWMFSVYLTFGKTLMTQCWVLNTYTFVTQEVAILQKNSKIASLMSYQRSDLRKTLKYSHRWTPFNFYRAMHVVLARYCYRKSSVRPSVRPSVCP